MRRGTAPQNKSERANGAVQILEFEMSELPKIQFYDTLTASKQVLETLEPGKVAMYVCGLTTYDYAHIGHARTFISFDMIRRYLIHRGYTVRLVRNHTDCDDKIIRRANEVGEDPLELAERFVDAFDADMGALNLIPPDVSPRVTQEIPAVIEMVEQLIGKGHAYDVDGDVFFEVGSFEGYGKLSKKVLEDLRAGERVEVDERKRNPADFALWKSVKPGEPNWDSPWGQGRPGWHIECSAMSTKYLGNSFDIHGGGRDLVFPHHENEIAQSEGATGERFSRYWMHAGPLTVGGEKMGKSLGNFWTIRDALAVYHPDVIRFFNLTALYRKSISYTAETLEEARSRVVYFFKTLRLLDEYIALSPPVEEGSKIQHGDFLNAYWAGVHEGMDNDFCTPRFLALMTEMAKLANENVPKKKKAIKDPVLLRTLVRIRADLEKSAEILGLFSEEPSIALTKIRDLRATQLGIDSSAVEDLIKGRAEARANKDWARADEIRDELAALQVVLMDSATGTTWEL